MHPQYATRLSCFAIVSSLETDIRAFLTSNDLLPTAFMPQDVRDKALKRWAADREAPTSRPDDERDLLPYCDFGDLSKIIRAGTVAITDIAAATALASRLDLLTGARNRVCHSRPLETDDFADLLELAREAPGIWRECAWSELDATMKRLEHQPSFVLHLQIPEFWRENRSREHNLPLPEFDDTGFLGRESDRRALTRLLLLPHPVISVLGEGGVGKTALAVRCLYDILEQHDCPFDAIVWVSLKTRVLTVSGAEDLRDSVRTVLGLVQSVAAQTGAPEAATVTIDECIAEILAYMQCFRTLVAIDNLETIGWETLRPLLSEIPSGSKALITSRVGLGEIEQRYPLKALDSKTAIDLARRFARTMNCGEVFKDNQSGLKKACDLLYNNPLLIKWYVRSVASGAPTSRLLNKEGLEFKQALQFCFENLFERLSETERMVVHVLASAGRPLTQVQLYYLTRASNRDEVDWALSTLHHSSMLRRTTDSMPAYASGALYGLTEIGAEFVSRFAPPSKEIFARVRGDMQQLSAESQLDSVKRSIYKFDRMVIEAHPGDETIVAAYLRRALKSSDRDDHAIARQQVSEAKNMMPHFAECFRVSAQVNAKADDLYAASRDFESAVELAPDSPVVRYHYWWFLQNKLNDLGSALQQADHALALTPGDPTLLSARAQTLMWLGRCREAAAVYDSLLAQEDARPGRWRLATRDQAAECRRRQSEQDWAQLDRAKAFGELSAGLAILAGGLARGDFDAAMLKRVGKIAEDWARHAVSAGDSEAGRELVAGLQPFRSRFSADGLYVPSWGVFAKTFSTIPGVETTIDSAEKPSVGTRLRGRVANLVPDKGFGFLSDSYGNSWFFWKGELAPQDWLALKTDDEVSFIVGSNNKGPCAKRVVRVES